MAKMVEMTFAIGAALAGNFSGVFGKAGQALSNLQKQSSELQAVSGQIDGYQKMQDSITKNQAAMLEAQNQAKALETQIVSSSQRTAVLKSQYGESQAEVERLNAVLVRNKDAYRAAQLNVQSLERQIRSSKTPTAELQMQYRAAQEEARRLGEAVKKSGAEFQQAQGKAKHLKSEMQASASQTRSLQTESRNLYAEAAKLKGGIDRDSEALAKLQSELSGAGVDTSRLAAEQARLTAQSQRLANAQARLQKSRAALATTRQQLSWGNVKGDLIKAAGIGLSLGAPVMQAADFEQASARLNAVAFSGGGRNKEDDEKDFKALKAQARQLGRDTQFTAVQAAQSQENLARAGFQANEIISAMPGLLDMAAAEGMDLANAADIMASSLRGFGLAASDAGRVSNILAQTSAASNSSIAGLGESLKYVAPVAKGLGVSIEETNAMLGIMANAGIKGSQGGTALRAAFTRLSKEPKAVAKALGALGISARDAQGNMREIPELMQALNNKMKNMGSADKMKYLSNIFGSEAASGMLAVMEAAVDGSLQKLTRLNRESSGQLQALSENVSISLDDLRAGMQDADKYARHLGISFSDLSVYTTMLAKSGIKGADADKALTSAFKTLSKSPQKVQKELKAFELSAYGENGKMRDFTAILTDLNKAMKDMKPPDQIKALNKIFGADAGKSIQTLMQGMEKGGSYDELSKVAQGARGVSQEMAEKVLATFSGQKEILKSAISDVMITVGDVLLPTVTQVVKSFTDWTASLGKLASEHPEATKSIIGLVSGIAALSVGITAMKYAWLGIKLPFQTAKVAFDVLSLGALKNADTLAEGAKSAGLFSKVSGKLSAGVKGIGKAFSAMGSWVSKAFSGIMNMGKSLISGLFSPLGLKIALIVGAIALLAAGAYLIYKNWDKIKAWWDSWTLKDVFAPVKDWVSEKAAWVKGKWQEFSAWWDSWTLGDVFAAVKGWASEKVAWVKGKWQEFSAWWDSWTFADVFAPVKEYAGSAKDYAMQKLTDLQTWWDSWTLGDVFAPVLEKGQAVWDKLSSTVESVKNIYAEKLSTVWDKMVTAYDKAQSVIVGKVISPVLNFTWDTIVEGWDIASGLVRQNFEKLKAFMQIDFSGFWDTLSSGFSVVCDTLKGAWNGVTGFIKDTWNTAADYVSGAWKWTKGLFGYDTDAEDLQTQIQDITALNKMSEGFTQRVAEMTAAWQPFKDSLGEGFEQIYSTMQGIADRIRGTVIPAVNELTSALSKVALEIAAIVQAGELSVDVHTPNTAAAAYSQTVGGTWRGRKRAEGGIITRPEIALIGEAGREAVIPLEKQARGVSLWYEAGRELGLIQNNNTYTENSYPTLSNAASILKFPPQAEAGREAVIPLEKQARGTPLKDSFSFPLNMPELALPQVNVQNTAPSLMNALKVSPAINNIIPHADGGIFSQPHIGLVAEAGREAIIPLENRSRGIPLWQAAGEEMGVSFSNTQPSRELSVSFAPNVSITVNGGEPDSEQKFRRILSDMFEDLFAEFQGRMQRLAFE